MICSPRRHRHAPGGRYLKLGLGLSRKRLARVKTNHRYPGLCRVSLSPSICNKPVNLRFSPKSLKSDAFNASHVYGFSLG